MKFSKVVQTVMYQHTDRKADPEKMQSGLFYRVPYISQKHANLCTDASMNMAFVIGKKPISSMTQNPRGAFDGKGYKELEDFKAEYIILNNFPPENTIQQTNRIKAEFTKVLTNSGPFIVNIGLRFGGRHSVLITGICGDNVIYNDPLTGANRTLTIQEIGALYGKRAVPYIDIAIPNFLSEKQREQIRTEKLSDTVEIVSDQKYKRHFTLGKMENPSDAVKEFLHDIVKRGKCSDEEKHKLTQFLSEHKNTNNVVTLVTSLDTTFPQEGQSEKLATCLQSVYHYMNIGDDGAHEQEEFLSSEEIPIVSDRAALMNAANTVNCRQTMAELRQGEQELTAALTQKTNP